MRGPRWFLAFCQHFLQTSNVSASISKQQGVHVHFFVQSLQLHLDQFIAFFRPPPQKFYVERIVVHHGQFFIKLSFSLQRGRQPILHFRPAIMSTRTAPRNEAFSVHNVYIARKPLSVRSLVPVNFASAVFAPAHLRRANLRVWSFHVGVLLWWCCPACRMRGPRGVVKRSPAPTFREHCGVCLCIRARFRR